MPDSSPPSCWAHLPCQCLRSILWGCRAHTKPVPSTLSLKPLPQALSQFPTVWEGIYVHSLTLPLCPAVWQVALHYGFKQCQQASLQHFTGLVSYGKLCLQSALRSLEVPRMSSAPTASLSVQSHQKPTCNLNIIPLKNQLLFGWTKIKPEQSSKTKNQEQNLSGAKGKGRGTPSVVITTKHLSLANNNIFCFHTVAVSSRHMGETCHATHSQTHVRSQPWGYSALPEDAVCSVTGLEATHFKKLQNRPPMEPLSQTDEEIYRAAFPPQGPREQMHH